MSGGAFSDATVDFGTGGKVLVTSPFALNLIIMFVSFFGVIVVAALAGQATYQDLDNNSTAFFYTAPITKFDYLARPFSGSAGHTVRDFHQRRLGSVGGHAHALARSRARRAAEPSALISNLTSRWSFRT